MKKLALILALVSLMAICFSSLTVNAAAPKLEDYFPIAEAVPEEDQVQPTTWNYFAGVDQLADPSGSWSWADTFQDKLNCWGMNQGGTMVNRNLLTLYWENRDIDFTDKGITAIRQLVFADAFTQSGVGDFGRINPARVLEAFETVTFIYSADGQNWNTIKDYTIAFHTNANTYTGYAGKEYPVDTYWHLIFDEAIPAEQCKYVGIHSSEPKAWDAQDHTPALGIIYDWKYTYLVEDNGEVALTYPEVDTTAAPTEAPATEAATTEAATDAAATTPVTEANGETAGLDAWVYVVIAVAVVAVVVVVIIVAKKKK